MSRSWLTLLLCMLVVSHTAYVRCEEGEDEEYADQDRALLLVRKFAKEDIAVQGRNLTISISVYNAGQSSALSVEVEDGALPKAFKLVSGSLKGSFERIPVGTNVTHEYVVVPSAASGTTELPPASVKYQAEMENEEFQVGKSNVIKVHVLTPSQQIQSHLLTTGSYITLGVFKTPNDWRNLVIVVLLLTVLVGGNWSYKKVTSAKQKWNREKHLKDFGLDSEDESTKKVSRKTRKLTEDKEN